MRALEAIIFDFDGVIADCRSGTLMPGADAFVRLAAAAVPIGIASGATTHEIHHLLSDFGLRDMFTAVIGCDSTARSKPSPDPYLEAVDRIRASGHAIGPSRVVAIDDSLSGLVSAWAAGLICVGLATTRAAAELAPHAKLVVVSLEVLTLDTLDTLVEA